MRHYICPACKRRRGVDISFGMPGPELTDLYKHGGLVLGGCVPPMIGEPERACVDCGHRWEIRRRAR